MVYLQIGNATTTGTLGTSNVVDNGALVFNRSNAMTVGNTISGTGTVTQSGSGTTTLSGSNSYSGVTNVNAGILSVTANNNLGTTVTPAGINFAGGTLLIGGTSTDFSTSRAITLNTGGGILDSGDSTNTMAFLAGSTVANYGAVLHTLNIRLFPEQVVYIVNHAEDGVVFVDDTLIEPLAELAPQLTGVRQYVVIGDGDLDALPDAVSYEQLLDDAAGPR